MQRQQSESTESVFLSLSVQALHLQSHLQVSVAVAVGHVAQIDVCGWHTLTTPGLAAFGTSAGVCVVELQATMWVCTGWPAA